MDHAFVVRKCGFQLSGNLKIPCVPTALGHPYISQYPVAATASLRARNNALHQYGSSGNGENQHNAESKTQKQQRIVFGLFPSFLPFRLSVCQEGATEKGVRHLF